VDLALAGVEGLEPPTPGFGGREALFGLIWAHFSKFDFSGVSALLQQRATDPTTLYLGPHLGPRFQTTTRAVNNRLLRLAISLGRFPRRGLLVVLIEGIFDSEDTALVRLPLQLGNEPADCRVVPFGLLLWPVDCVRQSSSLNANWCAIPLLLKD
jgi:hypothetical protein